MHVQSFIGMCSQIGNNAFVTESLMIKTYCVNCLWEVESLSFQVRPGLSVISYGPSDICHVFLTESRLTNPIYICFCFEYKQVFIH